MTGNENRFQGDGVSRIDIHRGQTSKSSFNHEYEYEYRQIGNLFTTVTQYSELGLYSNSQTSRESDF